MPALFLELFSEEIPARMQARGTEDLARLVSETFATLAPTEMRTYAGPRRIALAATVREGVAESSKSERGPRLTAPEQALAGFLRKHAATREELQQEGEFWVLSRNVPGMDAATLIARDMPGVLRKFPWPKSMRWGGSSRFTWVRPLRRIVCMLDGKVVPFDLRDGEDDGHGLASSNLTEGHRFLSPGAFAVESETHWLAALFDRHVIAEAAERRQRVWDGVCAKAAERGLTVVEDPGLLDEVSGLVEWPVPLLGRIDNAYMDLPPEVMQVSMRVNQRYFALRDADGKAAPWFAFVANITADDGGAAIIAGNERVLRARFSDARHFWDLDRTRTLESRVEDLRAVTFHAKLGTQLERVERLVHIAGKIAPLVGANVTYSQDAARLCKADLTTGMVGEFPELQGVMGAYYARHDGWDRAVCEAVRDHYAPRGQDDMVPTQPVTVAVALADKLDQLVQFFGIGEKPTGSGDPFALRRAALGVLRLLDENELNLRLTDLLALAGAYDLETLLDFLKDRLRLQWLARGRRYDILLASFSGTEDRIDDLAKRVDALETLLDSDDGINLLSGYRRAANILRIESAKDGPHDGAVNGEGLFDPAERELWIVLSDVSKDVDFFLPERFYEQAISRLASLRAPLDRFFDDVIVNSPQQSVRENRLRLLSEIVLTMNRVADFSKIEG